MKNSLKKAILFSTLAFGTLEVTSVASNNIQPIAHADTTQTASNQASNAVSSQFSDPGMQAAILTSAQKQYGSDIKSINDITQSDLDNLTSLFYPSWYKQITISSFNNIDKLTNLKSINLINVKFDANINLLPIKKLSNLESLTVENAGITSQMINALSGYSNPNLKDIDLSNNNIQDVNFMKSISIPNVIKVNISANNISDFSAIAGLNWPNLNELNASYNQISDISPIAKVNWPNLTILNASNNLISDVSPIAQVNWPKLSNVNVSNNQISDISVIKNTNWPEINTINVSNNNISDINPISSAKWTKLTSIYADNNHIKNIDNFANTDWVSLKTISVNNNNIGDISSMKGTYNHFSNLTQFYVDNNQISDLSFMQGFKFDNGSALNQNIVKTVNNINKPQKGQTISIPVSLVDLDLSNNNVGQALTNPQKQYLLISGLHDSGMFTIIGKDGKQYYQNDDDTSNGIDHIEFKYNGGELPNSVSFNFTSGLGITDSIFSGSYNIILNWKDNLTNTTQSNIVTNTTTNVNDNGSIIDSHSNNAGKATVTYGKVIATRGLNLYKKNAFTKKNKIKSFKKAYGTKRPLFKVLKKVTSSVNTPRYYVVQIDPITNKEIKGSRGYITAKGNYVTPLYYSNSVKSVKVLSKTVTAYKKVNLKDAANKYKRGTVLKVKSIKEYGNAYALQLQNGQFVTANKYFVVKVK